MKYKNNRKFKRMREKLWKSAGKGLLAGIMVMGANSALAEAGTNYSYVQEGRSNQNTGMHMMRRFNSLTRIKNLASQLGLDGSVVKNDLKSGKPLKQILQENGVLMEELNKALS